MKKAFVGMASVVVCVGAFVAGVPVLAGDTNSVQTVPKQTPAPFKDHYVVLVGPVKFFAFTSERVTDYRDKGFQLLVSEPVTLPGQDSPLQVRIAGNNTPLNQGSELFLGDMIVSGAIQSTGGSSGLRDSNGNVTLLRSGETAIVVPASPPGTAAEEEDPPVDPCRSCVTMAAAECNYGVKSVTCSVVSGETPSYSCAFVCFPEPATPPPPPSGEGE